MSWILESTLSAISRCERERSLTLEARLMLAMQHGAPGRPSIELLRFQTEHGRCKGRNATNR